MKRLDIIIIAVVLFVAGGLYFSGILSPGEKGGEAVVYVDGEEKARYSLSENITDTIETENGINEIEIKDGKVSMVYADCRDQICVNHVPINKEHESIICLPHKVVVEIENGEENDVDVVAK